MADTDTTDPNEPSGERVIALTPAQLALVGLIGALLLFWRRRRRGDG